MENQNPIMMNKENVNFNELRKKLSNLKIDHGSSKMKNPINDENMENNKKAANIENHKDKNMDKENIGNRGKENSNSKIKTNEKNMNAVSKSNLNTNKDLSAAVKPPRKALSNVKNSISFTQNNKIVVCNNDSTKKDEQDFDVTKTNKNTAIPQAQNQMNQLNNYGFYQQDMNNHYNMNQYQWHNNYQYHPHQMNYNQYQQVQSDQVSSVRRRPPIPNRYHQISNSVAANPGNTTFKAQKQQQPMSENNGNNSSDDNESISSSVLSLSKVGVESLVFMFECIAFLAVYNIDT